MSRRGNGPTRPGRGGAPTRPLPESVGGRGARRFGWRVGLGLAGLVGLGGLLGWAVLGSGLFAVRAVEVTGVSRLSAAEVRAAGAVPVGASLALVDTAAVHRRVAALRPVASVDVSRRWPRTLRITVGERAPVVAVPRGGGLVLLDRAGVPFARVPHPPAGVVTLEVTRPGPRDAATRAGLAVLTALPPSVRDALAGVSADHSDAVTLRLRTGARVEWGSAARSPRKAAVLVALLRRPAQVYDVSVPDVPTTR